jgi:hypothetical protein
LQLNLLTLPVDFCADDEKTIGPSQRLIARGIATADSDGIGCFLEDFKVVCDEGAFVVIASRELLVGP